MRRKGSAQRAVLRGLFLALFATGGCVTPGESPSSGASTSPATSNGSYERVIAPFVVLDAGGMRYDHPFIGGFKVPRPQFVDIDGDGTLDLFVHERSNQLMHFENVGTASEPRYEWRTDRWQELHTGEWTRFVDLDGDGRVDLLAEEPYSYVRVYLNEGSAREARMVLAPDSLRDDQGRPLFADRQNVPAIHDIDGNGRLDLFLGRIDGTVSHYEAMDGGGGEEGLPRFRLMAERFEGIEILGTIILPTLHGANSMYFADGNGSGVMDLYWGDFFEAGLLFIENRGSPSSPAFQSTPRAVQADGEPIVTSGFNAPVFADVSGTGWPDLFIGVLGGAYNPISTASENFHHYRNDGGELSLVTKRFLYGIDLGEEAVPALTDFNGNGRIDILVGNKIDPGETDTGRLYWYENVGDPLAPRFQLRDTLSLARSYHYAPTPAELWGDELPGIALGTFNDGVLFYRNVGVPGAPELELQEELTVQLTRGSQSAPALADLTGNGLLDLVVGRSNGELSFYRNVGTPTEPRFELESDQWMGIRVGRRSHPSFVDLDGNGLLDLVLGREAPGAVVFRNTGTPAEPRFEEDPSVVIELHPYGAPAFADLTGNGVPELIAGGASGGLVYFERR